MRTLAQDARNEPELEWGEPTVVIVTAEDPGTWAAGSAQYLALPGPPPPSFAELARPVVPALPAVEPAPAEGRHVVRPPTDWTAKQVAVEIIAAARAARSPTEFEPVVLAPTDELGTWEPWNAEPVPALILNDLLDEREGVS